jgi:ATP-dependent Lhr-like helicase
MQDFHPIIAQWFVEKFHRPTDIQHKAWSSIRQGENTLMSAPTGSGKTFAAFLVFIDQLLKQSLNHQLSDGVQILYISPLKALSNDINRNLSEPLKEIWELTASQNSLPTKPIRVQVRTGDTPTSERVQMLKRPPHILVTTPESFYLLLTSTKARHILKTVQSVIVDEIHALARDKRGSHLLLGLERLDHWSGRKVQRIGISATQKPMETIAKYLVGRNRPCTIWNTGHARDLKLALKVPDTPLTAVCSGEQWEQVYRQIIAEIQSHRSTIIFVNTRRMAERVAYRLREVLGEGEAVASHHGSLSRERRFEAEEALKAGQLKAIVATASLELGIDIGHIDLVIQIGSPRNIAVFLQRIGRSGHAIGKRPEGQLFALTWDEAIEGLALIQAVRAGTLDQIVIPNLPIDILCQQIIAAVSLDEWDETELYHVMAGVYANCTEGTALTWETYQATLEMLANGYSSERRERAWIVRDRLSHKLRARRGTNLAALNSGGAIPELGEYRVVLEDDSTVIGTVNEDFALESQVGSIFLLGNHSWQILTVGSGKLMVRDAGNRSPTIPFWEGEAYGRSLELSQAVSQMRASIADELQDQCFPGELDQLSPSPTSPLGNHPSTCAEYEKALEKFSALDPGISPWALTQILHYVAIQKKAMGTIPIPTSNDIVFERFFDESGGMQLVIHSCYGMAINRAFGLALRKRFCRSFNFELQASADDNGIVLSLGPQHSFEISSLFTMLNPRNVEEILIQALLDVPMFKIRWRWNATRSLAVLRNKAGKKVPPPLQRFLADDLLTAAFPMATACLENIKGDIVIPDNPLVQQTVHDCLQEAMNLEGLKTLLTQYASGEVRFHAFDAREPSPFCYQLLNAYPYAFLDDAPLQERRARAVQTRRTLSASDMQDLGRLDSEAIATVVREAWPLVRDPDECFMALLDFILLPWELIQESWQVPLAHLLKTGRASIIETEVGGKKFVYATENAELIQHLINPTINDKMAATQKLLGSHLNFCGPITTSEFRNLFGLDLPYESAIAALENQGQILRGHFRDLSSKEKEMEICHRRLLMRIHLLTLKGLRQQIDAIGIPQFVQFLCDHHHVWDGTEFANSNNPHKSNSANNSNGPHNADLEETLAKLQGLEIPAAEWENEILPTRLPYYREDDLDHLCSLGEIAWGRVGKTASKGLTGLGRSTPIAFFNRRDPNAILSNLLAQNKSETEIASDHGKQIVEILRTRGACFPWDLEAKTKLFPSQIEQALKELAMLGIVSCDSFAGLRAMIGSKRTTSSPKKLRGRFYLIAEGEEEEGVEREKASTQNKIEKSNSKADSKSELKLELKLQLKTEFEQREKNHEAWIDLLLARYGIICRDLVQKETLAPPWFELVRLLRTREMKGLIRGGLFVKGLSGEQYAYEETIENLRRSPPKNLNLPWVVISVHDPINVYNATTNAQTALSSLIPPIPKDQSQAQKGKLKRLLLRQGEVIGYKFDEEVKILVESDPVTVDLWQRALRLQGRVRSLVLKQIRPNT